MRTRARRPGRTRLRPGVAMCAALLGLGLLGACDALDELLAVDKPVDVPAEALNDPTKAVLLVNGAISDFDCALGSFIVMGGLVGEEYIDATQTADRWPYDRREVQPGDARYSTFGCATLGTYVPLSTARFTADQVLGWLEGWTDAEMPTGVNRTRLIATSAAYAGYSYLLMGEMFCSAAVDQGPEMFPPDFFNAAVGRFTRAIEAATAVGGAPADSIRYMALVGRARARVNLGQYAAAAADAALVPAGFVKAATASDAADRRRNRVFAQNNQTDGVTVGPRYRNPTVEGVPDPRVRATDTGRNATDGNRMWQQNKYAGLGTPVPIATYDEAQLILAEAALRGGSPTNAVNIINALRARSATPAYTGPTDAASVMALLIEERRRELWLEGQHLYDTIRFDITLQPATGTTFPKGGIYGNTKCLPLPNVERLNNPNLG
ncbi:MAG TPA: RagB/SusD family nutrient uptake outer membrane protein [Longimicrobium sp.]|nr:RagB/SusD family nutrient uptake outer membrane protein [Longimicrobium sp.]